MTGSSRHSVSRSRGILYATSGSDAVHTALGDVFQETKVIDRRRNEPWLAAIDLEAALQLLDDQPLHQAASRTLMTAGRQGSTGAGASPPAGAAVRTPYPGPPAPPE